MIIKSWQEVCFLLKLFDVDSGIMSEIIRKTGIYSVKCGKGYRLKSILLDEGILESDSYDKDDTGTFRESFRVNHKVLKQVLAFEIEPLNMLKREFNDIMLRPRKK